MLSRAASVPRVCWTCRIALTQRRVAPSPRSTPIQGRRYYASDPTIQSKQRIEALISGTSKDWAKKKSSNSSRRRGRGRKGKARDDRDDDSLPDWLMTTKDKSKPSVQESRPSAPDRGRGRGRGRSSKKDDDGDGLADWLTSTNVKSKRSTQQLESSAQDRTQEHDQRLSSTKEDDDESFPDWPVGMEHQEKPLVQQPEQSTFTPETEQAPTTTEAATESEIVDKEPAKTYPVSAWPPTSDITETIPPTTDLPLIDPSADPSTSSGNKPQREFQHDLLHYQQLGLDALGEPVDALIIKNPNRMKRSKKPVPVLAEEPPIPCVDVVWENFVPVEDDIGSEESPENVWKNIEELRPRDATVLRQKDFDKLTNELVDGFTRDQLVSYFSQDKWENKQQTLETPSHAWIEKQGPWQAAKPSDWTNLKPKQYQATLIMLVRWNMEVQEHVEGLGRTPVWLRPDVFQLIARPSSPVFETLKADFMDSSNNEKITSNSEESRLHIYTRKATTAVILSRLNEIIESIASRTVSIPHVKVENLTEPILTELGRVTDTNIQYKKQESELVVSWLSNEDRPRPDPLADAEDIGNRTEDPANVVMRLLLRRQTEPPSTKAKIVRSSKNATAKEELFVGYHRETKSMAWRDKLRKWSRYISPVEKPSHIRPQPLQLSKVDIFPETSVQGKGIEAQDRHAASFGHILHAELKDQDSKSVERRRILSPVLPHPASLTSATADNDKPVVQHTDIILHFAPASQGKTFDSASRGVQLRLPVNPDNDFSNFSLPADATLDAVVAVSDKDLLLPNESVDIRLAHSRLVSLDVQQKALKDFMAASEFKLLEGRLRTPPQAILAFPSKLISPKSKKQPDTDTVGVPCTFMGLEIHQSVEMEWHGHTMRYVSIEAGHHGGQRQELSLVAATPDSFDEALGVGRVESFLDLVEEIAMGKHFSWNDGSKLMQERGIEDFNLELADEEPEDEIPFYELEGKSSSGVNNVTDGDARAIGLDELSSDSSEDTQIPFTSELSDDTIAEAPGENDSSPNTEETSEASDPLEDAEPTPIEDSDLTSNENTEHTSNEETSTKDQPGQTP